MDILLDENSLRWKQLARDVAERVVRPLAWKYDHLQEYPWEIRDALAEAGLMKVWIPREYGGEGPGVLNLCLVVEELSRCCGGVGVLFAVNALGSFPILVGGTDEQKKRWLPPLARGEKLISFGLSEKGAGSDAGGLSCRAEVRGDRVVLNGQKKWNTNGGAADYYVVFCVSDPESKSRRISAVVVEKGTPGFRIGKVENKMGIRCVPVVELEFENCEVPIENLIGGSPGYGFKHAMQTLDLARPGVASQAVGCAQGALEFAAVYAQQRVQFGQPIISFQMIQQMLADGSTKIEAARQLVHAAARCIDKGGRDVTKASAQCKLFATDVAMEVTTNAVQIFGGYGYMRDYPIEKYMRDAKITQIYEGTNQVQRMVVARNVAKEAMSWKHLEKYIPLPPEVLPEAEKSWTEASPRPVHR